MWACRSTTGIVSHGGNPGTERSLRSMWQQESTIRGMETAPMQEMMVYVSQALPSATQAD